MDAETARRHGEVVTELEEAFAASHVPYGTPASPPTSAVAPEGIQPFGFLIQRHARPAGRADQLGIRLNPPPEAPAAQRRALPYKSPPAEALPPPNLPANPAEEGLHPVKYKGPPELLLPRPKFRLHAIYKGPPAVLCQPKPSRTWLRPPDPASRMQSVETQTEEPPDLPNQSMGTALTPCMRGPPDLASRVQAMQTQIIELWELNQYMDTGFDHLAAAIDYAYEEGYISAAELQRLEMVNKNGNDAKHAGLGPRAGSRSRSPARRVGRGRSAGSRSLTPVARAPSRAASSRDLAPISARAQQPRLPNALPAPWAPMRPDNLMYETED